MKLLDYTFKDMMRLSSVPRWTIVEMSRQQSVAEHSYNVAIISLMLINNIPWFMNHKAAVLEYSLVHDMPELVTGDTPTSMKDRFRNVFDDMEAELFPETMLLKSGLNRSAAAIVKLADYIEAIQHAEKYCIDSRKDVIIEEMKQRAFTHIIDTMPSMLLKEIDSFMRDLWNVEKTS